MTEVLNAAQELPEGRKEGVPQHDKAVWPEAWAQCLLRRCQQARERQDAERESEERVPQEKAPLTRTCQGPTHDNPVELPYNQFYIHKSGAKAGQVYSECIECTLHRGRQRDGRKATPNAQDAYLAGVAKRNQVKDPTPDLAWWVHTGMEWIPRFGEEALGADF